MKYMLIIIISVVFMGCSFNGNKTEVKERTPCFIKLDSGKKIRGIICFKYNYTYISVILKRADYTMLVHKSRIQWIDTKKQAAVELSEQLRKPLDLGKIQ